jgi:hypothetical protein
MRPSWQEHPPSAAAKPFGGGKRRKNQAEGRMPEGARGTTSSAEDWVKPAGRWTGAAAGAVCLSLLFLPMPDYDGQQTKAAQMAIPTTAQKPEIPINIIQLNESTLISEQKSLKNWNKRYISCGIAALFATGLALVCSFFIYTQSNTVSELEKSVRDEKDRISGERIAAAEQRVAEANLETQRLKSSLAWRELSSAQTLTLQAAVRGRIASVQVDNILSDPESLNLCLQLEGAFRSAGLAVIDGSAVAIVQSIPRGIIIFGRPQEAQIMKEALTMVGLEATATIADKPLSILVASKSRVPR